MWTLAQNNLILLVVALVVGLAVALWLFRGKRASSDGPEGNALPDEFAAATQDVAGEIFGVDAHPNIPGPSGPPDNLQLLKGVGPKLAAEVDGFGHPRFGQVGGLAGNGVALLGRRMGGFGGWIGRGRVVEAGWYFGGGDTDGFEAKFGKL